jgi:hypothetical protein
LRPQRFQKSLYFIVRLLRHFPVFGAIRLAREQLHVHQFTTQRDVITVRVPRFEHAVHLFFVIALLRIKAKPQTPGRVAFLPFKAMTFKSLKYKGYSENPKSLAEHLERARIMRGLSIIEAATELKVTRESYANWINSSCEQVRAAHIPQVIAFLGYNPEPEGRTDGERVARKRRAMGLAAKELAKLLRLREKVVHDFEADRTCAPRAKVLLEFIEPDTPPANTRFKRNLL